MIPKTVLDMSKLCVAMSMSPSLCCKMKRNGLYKSYDEVTNLSNSCKKNDLRAENQGQCKGIVL